MSVRLLALPAAAIALMAVAGARPAPGNGAAGPGRLDWPIAAGWVLTQPYGCTPFLLEPAAAWCASGHFHSGIDLAAPEGTAVLAAAGGVAHLSLDPAGYGLCLVLDTGEGTVTLYGHLSAAKVGDGARVAAGEEIGRVGSSGLSTGPHLHFEVRRDGRPVDPLPLLPAVR